MNSFPYWIQRANFVSTEYDPVNVEGALHAFMAHDWRAELELVSKDAESCPPGIGFMDPNGSILHVCPYGDGRSLVHYHAKTVSKLLGIIPISRSAVHTKQHVSESDVHELIRSFFNRDHAQLLRKLAAT